MPAEFVITPLAVESLRLSSASIDTYIYTGCNQCVKQQCVCEPDRYNMCLHRSYSEVTLTDNNDTLTNVFCKVKNYEFSIVYKVVEDHEFSKTYKCFLLFWYNIGLLALPQGCMRLIYSLVTGAESFFNIKESPV